MSEWRVKRVRFGVRTLLVATAVVAIVGGGLRRGYDVRIGEYESQQRVADFLARKNAKVMWSVTGPERLQLWRYLDERLLKRATHAYFDGVATQDFAEITQCFRELPDMRSAVVLARQVVPQAREAQAGRPNAVIDALRASAVRHLVVDASIRGTPEEFASPIYTRDDLAALEAALPGVRVIWIEVN